MKRIVFFLVFLIPATAEVAESTVAASPLKVVNARMQAYNDHDLTSFLSLYADDVQIYTYPDKLLNAGKSGLRSIFEPLFDEGRISVEIHSQIEKDSYVINHETVDYGNEKIEYVSIYEVRDGRIASVRFVRD